MPSPPTKAASVSCCSEFKPQALFIWHEVAAEVNAFVKLHFIWSMTFGELYDFSGMNALMGENVRSVVKVHSKTSFDTIAMEGNKRTRDVLSFFSSRLLIFCVQNATHF